MSAECASCGNTAEGNTWKPGQCLVGLNLFACSLPCAIKVRDEYCKPGAPIEQFKDDNTFEIVEL